MYLAWFCLWVHFSRWGLEHIWITALSFLIHCNFPEFVPRLTNERFTPLLISHLIHFVRRGHLSGWNHELQVFRGGNQVLLMGGFVKRILSGVKLIISIDSFNLFLTCVHAMLDKAWPFRAYVAFHANWGLRGGVVWTLIVVLHWSEFIKVSLFVVAGVGSVDKNPFRNFFTSFHILKITV